MKRGVLIYDAVGARRNKWFIDGLVNGFSKHDMRLDPVICCGNDYKSCYGADFAIVRTIAPQINKELESAGVRVFNNYLTSHTANDKWLTYKLCKELCIPVLDTHYSLEELQPLTFPQVVKSCDGHGGAEVFWTDNLCQFNAVADKMNGLGKPYVYQAPCSDLGKDMRIYVLGDKILASVLRFNPDGFKSNYSLGGQVKAVKCEDYQIDIVKKISGYLKSDYIGIDFISHKGRWVLNEIEDVVGSRMLYEVSDVDVIEKYVLHIKNSVQ